MMRLPTNGAMMAGSVTEASHKPRSFPACSSEGNASMDNAQPTLRQNHKMFSVNSWQTECTAIFKFLYSVPYLQMSDLSIGILTFTCIHVIVLLIQMLLLCKY